MANRQHGNAPFARTSFAGESSGADIQIILTASGIVLPAVQVTTSYGLNAIPTATALIPLGKNARTGIPSPAYAAMASLKQMTPVEIRFAGKAGDYSPQGSAAAANNGAKEQWPVDSKGHLLFMGYVSGTTYRRSQGNITLVVNFINKLFDLASSSAGSADLVPGAPNSLVFPAFAKGAGGDKAGNSGGMFTKKLNTDIDTDLSTGIKNVLEEMCFHPLQTHNAVGGGDSSPFCSGLIGDSRDENTGARNLNNSDFNGRALGVIEANGDWKGITNYGKNYKLAVAEVQKDHAIQSIGQICYSSLGGTSMWSMLISRLLPQFGMGVVPVANGAYIVPIAQALRFQANQCRTIYPREYADLSLTTQSTRVLYGVGIIASYNSGTLPPGDAGNQGKACVGAAFTAKIENEGDPAAQGQWMFQRAPRWCDDWVSTDPGPATGEERSIEKLLNEPSHDATGGAENAFSRDTGNEADAWNDSLERYAQQLYVANALRDRSGTVTGKLRFDISPGSTIKIQSQNLGPDLNALGTSNVAGVGEGAGLPTGLVGLVARVTSTINAEQASASSTYELTHVRTDVEDTLSDRFAVDKPPFFDEAFYGAPLVDSLDVNPVGA
jgi:hypothetical protein